MAYEVPESKKSIDQDKFDFTIGSKKFQVVKAKYLTGGALEDLTSGKLTRIFDAFGPRGTKIGDAVRDLDIEQIQGLVTAWVADSGLDAGKSSAS